MIHPSYVDLMEVVNKNVEEGETPVINSRYSIVMATAKRARQIVDGDEPLVKVSRGEKPLSIAVDELNQAEIRILAEDEVEEEYEILTRPRRQMGKRPVPMKRSLKVPARRAWKQKLQRRRPWRQRPALRIQLQQPQRLLRMWLRMRLPARRQMRFPRKRVLQKKLLKRK